MSRQDDPAYIRREGELYGQEPEKFLALSAIMRQSAKSQWLRAKRQEASEKGEDVEVVTRQALDLIKSTLEAEFGSDEPAAPGFSTSFIAPEPPQMPMPRGLFGGTPGGEIPPGRRQGGDRPSDLIGDSSRPRTLADIYSRWPIGKDEQFYIRVERLQPRTFQNVACSGYIGDISVEMTEKDFGTYFGGKDYALIVYGPDPRGRKDENGESVVKALADPVKLSVPVLPPNLFATSISKEDLMPFQPGNMQHPFNPFGMPGTPPNAAEAQIHSKTLDTMGTLLKMEREDSDRAVRQASQQSESVLRLLNDNSQRNVEMLQKQAEREATLLQAQLDRKEKELQELKGAVAERTNTGSTDTVELIRALAPDKDDTIQRIEQMSRQQLDMIRANHEAAITAMRTNHDAAVASMRTNHEAELRRADERLRELTSDATRDREKIRQDYESREHALKEDLQTVRRELREDADKRLSELKDRFQDQIHSLEKANEREIRNLKENGETRLHVTDKTSQMEVQNLRERLAEAQQEQVRLREELEASKDPVAVKEKAEALAEAFGYTKPEEGGPKGVWETLAATLGAGVGQAIGSINEWGPQMLDRIQNARATGQMPPQQMPPQLPPGHPGAQVPQLPPGHPAAPQAAPRRRQQSMVWATEGAGAPLPTPVSRNPQLGFVDAQAEGQPLPQQGQQQVIQTATPPQQGQQQAQPAQQDPQAAQQAAMEAELEKNLPPLPPDISGSFRKIEVVGFAQYIEQQIKGNVEPGVFVDLFHGAAPEQAAKAATISKDSFLAYMRTIPGNDESPIMSRAGLKWIDRLWVAFRKKYG